MINTWLEQFYNLQWYIHMALGASATIILLLILKWMSYKLKALATALKIIFTIALVVGLIVFFIVKH